MGSVIKTSRFNDAKAVRVFARLAGVAAKSEADILRDPMPHLNRASGEIYRLRRALEDARYALMGAPASYNPSVSIDIESMESKLLKRNTAAYDVISAALESNGEPT